MRTKNITNKSKIKIKARYDMIMSKFKDSSLDELKTVFNDKSIIKSNTDRTAILHLTQMKMQEQARVKVIDDEIVENE